MLRFDLRLTISALLVCYGAHDVPAGRAFSELDTDLDSHTPFTLFKSITGSTTGSCLCSCSACYEFTKQLYSTDLLGRSLGYDITCAPREDPPVFILEHAISDFQDHSFP
jgi:hypothetical protein